MGVLITIIIIIIFLFISGMVSDIQVKAKQKELQRQKQEEEERIQKRKNDIELVKKFAKDNNSNIDSLLKERNNLYNLALNNYTVGKLSKPLIPSTVSPVYKGNVLTEYMADKINNERQESYYNSLSSSQNKIDEGLRYQRDCKQQENRILSQLKDIPESEKYIKILEKYFTEDHKFFNK